MLGFYLLNASFRGHKCWFKTILCIDLHYFSFYCRLLLWSDPISDFSSVAQRWG